MVRDLHEGRSYWRLFDQDSQAHGCHRIDDILDAEYWQKKGWGIFWSVNEFRGGAPRRKDNLARILSWAVETDQGTKPEQLDLIFKFPEPSAVIETARGFHVYYNAIDAKPENWNAVVLDRLVYTLHGDPRARDLCRILRVPGFYHLKDPSSPFLVELVHESGAAYTEAQMLAAFPARPVEPPRPEKPRSPQRFNVTGDARLHDKIWGLDCERALERLSGTAAVNFERFTFVRAGAGNLNIFVNGKGTSCFIDKNKRIGSSDGGGPTIWQWVNWYHRDHKKTYAYIREVFPELFE